VKISLLKHHPVNSTSRRPVPTEAEVVEAYHRARTHVLIHSDKADEDSTFIKADAICLGVCYVLCCFMAFYLRRKLQIEDNLQSLFECRPRDFVIHVKNLPKVPFSATDLESHLRAWQPNTDIVGCSVVYQTPKGLDKVLTILLHKNLKTPDAQKLHQKCYILT